MTLLLGPHQTLDVLTFLLAAYAYDRCSTAVLRVWDCAFYVLHVWAGTLSGVWDAFESGGAEVLGARDWW